MKKLLLVVAGPTASGKTDFSLILAEYFKSEIISADSRQIYNELTIGSAKPSPAQLDRVPHHFINKYSVTVNYNAGQFAFEGRLVLEELFKRHPMVIVTGGSGLYIDALLYGIDDLPEANQEIRLKLNEKYKAGGISFLLNELKRLDPAAYDRIDKSNPNRIIRALEVSLVSGKPFSSFLMKDKKELPYSVLYLGLNVQRDILYERINKRVDLMIESGLVDEVNSLIRYRNYPALKTVGYAELMGYLDGNLNLPDAIEKIKQHTRNYAKRQMTWFRKNTAIEWIDPSDEHLVLRRVESLLK